MLVLPAALLTLYCSQVDGRYWHLIRAAVDTAWARRATGDFGGLLWQGDVIDTV